MCRVKFKTISKYARELNTRQLHTEVHALAQETSQEMLRASSLVTQQQNKNNNNDIEKTLKRNERRVINAFLESSCKTATFNSPL